MGANAEIEQYRLTGLQDVCIKRVVAGVDYSLAHILLHMLGYTTGRAQVIEYVIGGLKSAVKTVQP